MCHSQELVSHLVKTMFLEVLTYVQYHQVAQWPADRWSTLLMAEFSRRHRRLSRTFTRRHYSLYNENGAQGERGLRRL